ncbi:4'-phosphopantetheinyl transferase family protein [Vibrio mimicus]|uniref:4'-phosphopantetheinyl transferase family protein n=1 Tax=Vibrio mimicus TaxID=674 RepID=UPI002FF16294
MDDSKFFRHLGDEFLISPKHIVCHSISFNVSQYHPNSFLEYGIDEPITLNKAVNKRKAEYLAGRYVAREALKKLTQQNYQIPIGDNRAPQWPDGISGSITHTDTYALAAVSYFSDHQIIGVDLESWMSPSLAQELAPRIIDAFEQSLLERCELEFYQGITLIFSAKESLYKALYPQVKQFFGFEDARVDWIESSSGQFQITLLRALSAAYPKGWQAVGRYFVHQDVVLTIITD